MTLDATIPRPAPRPAAAAVRRTPRVFHSPVLAGALCAAALFGAAPRASAQGIEIKTKNAAAADTQRLKVEANADPVNAYLMNSVVGIGTATPAELLEINGNVRGNQSGALRISTGNGYIDIGPKNASFSHFVTDRGRFYLDKEIRVDTGLIGSYDEDLALQTSGTTRVTIRNTDGYVTIGTGAPRAQLDVPAGDVYAGQVVRITAPSNGTNAALLELYNETTNNYWHITERSGDADKLIFWRWNGSFASVLTLTQDQRVGIGTTAPRDRLDIAPAGSEASIFGVDKLVGWNDLRFYEDDAGTSMIAMFSAGRFYVQNTGNPGVELRDTDGGTPYLDFSNDNAVDYDARLILNSDAELGLADARLRITFGNWSGMYITTSGGRTVSLENNTGMNGGGGLRVWDQSGAGMIADFNSDGTAEIGANRLETNAGSGTIRLNDGDNNIWFIDNGTFRCYVDVTNVKNFVIPHPTDGSKWLVHTALEGPENAVFYRGEGRLRGGRAEVVLPSYFEALTREEGRTVQVAPVAGDSSEPVSRLGHSRVENGRFLVRAVDGRNPDQAFTWEVKAVRRDVPPLRPDPRRDEVETGGIGPYRWHREARPVPSLYPE